MVTVIKNARTVEGESVDICIQDDTIATIGRSHRIVDRTFDAEGRLALPGIIDPHVHFRVPGEEHKEDWGSGSRAAVAGGVTTVLDMPNNTPPTTTRDRLQAKRRMIAGKSYVNYGLYIGAMEDTVDEIANAEGAVGVKIYLGTSTGELLLSDYSIVERILQCVPCIVACHSEDERCLENLKSQISNLKLTGSTAEMHNGMRPEECAIIAARKLVAIVEKIRKPLYICHVSSARELAIFRAAKHKGLPIYLEATPHHLFLDIESARCLGNFACVNPPIRSSSSRTALQQALKDGLIDTIGSDHAPHTKNEKDRSYKEAPSGMPGVETMLPLMLDFVHSGAFTIQDLVRCMCENPARIFRLARRGELAPGYYADITLVDDDLTRVIETNTIYTKCGWSAFAGRSITGFPYATIVNGELVFLNGRIIGNPCGRDIMAHH